MNFTYIVNIICNTIVSDAYMRVYAILTYIYPIATSTTMLVLHVHIIIYSIRNKCAYNFHAYDIKKKHTSIYICSIIIITFVLIVVTQL